MTLFAGRGVTGYYIEFMVYRFINYQPYQPYQLYCFSVCLPHHIHRYHIIPFDHISVTIRHTVELHALSDLIAGQDADAEELSIVLSYRGHVGAEYTIKIV